MDCRAWRQADEDGKYERRHCVGRRAVRCRGGAAGGRDYLHPTIFQCTTFDSPRRDNMNPPLTGIIPPMITPLRGRDELDLAGLEKLIERILAGGVSGLFILGTTGEGPSLSYRL